MGHTSRRRKVVVCGAGPVGALAAIYAAQRGDDVEVYELRSDLREPSTTPLNFTRSINLALSERGKHALRGAELGDLLEKVLSESIPLKARMIHGRNANGRNFQESQSYDTHGRYNSAIDRGALNKVLLDALDRMPNVKLNFNHKLVGADFDRNVAWFEPRQKQPSRNSEKRAEDVTVSFDLLIGADGAHSATRYHMMKYARISYQQEYIDCLWCEFTIKPDTSGMQGKFAIDPNHLHIWPAGSFMFIAIASTDGSFTCTLFASAQHFDHLSTDSAARLPAFFDRHFPGVSPDLIPTSSLVEQFKQNPHLPLISIKCSPHHHRSSVVILGDAAHAMVPFYGQGMNAGFEDVYTLFSVIDAHHTPQSSSKSATLASNAPSPTTTTESSLESALEAYTALRVPDAHTINDLALSNYREMSAAVRSPLYKLKKWLEESVSVYAPWTGWRTLYVRVSYENGRYSDVVRAVAVQERVLWVVMGLIGASLAVGVGTVVRRGLLERGIR